MALGFKIKSNIILILEIDENPCKTVKDLRSRLFDKIRHLRNGMLSYKSKKELEVVEKEYLRTTNYLKIVN